MILSWYFFKDIESLRFCKTISWRLCFIFVDIMKMMHKSFKFSMKIQIKVEWLFFVISTTCRVLIFDWIAVNFCFFCSSSCWSITWISCSLISRESLFSASLLSYFIIWCLFSDIMSCKIKTSSLQLCCNHIAIVMLEY